jgi:hypothetical protein
MTWLYEPSGRMTKKVYVWWTCPICWSQIPPRMQHWHREEK